MSKTAFRPGVGLILIVVAPVLAACGSSLSDYSLKDQEWFSRPGKILSRSVTIETPPLSPSAVVSANDLINADGVCAGLTASEANASADGQAVPTGAVALGHTECDVARAAGSPDSVNISTNERGDRVAVLTYAHGPRPGVYRFTSGRLTDVEGVPGAEPPAKSAKKSKRPS